MVSDLFSLKDDVAIITGGAGGLGTEMAYALAEAGANVVIASRDEAKLNRTAAEISEATGRKIVGRVLDVTDRSSVESIVSRTLAEFGKIDILINNAGINVRSPIDDITDEDWHRIQQVNVTGVFYCCRAVSKHMVKAGYGRIINIGSALSLVGLAGRVSYTASKGAVAQITRTLALELAESSVTVNCVCPGPFATEINKPVMEDAEATMSLMSNIPMNRWAQPHEIKAPVVFLASHGAGFVTGAMITVDGGWTAK